MMFTFFVFDRRCLFWEIWSQNLEALVQSKNLILKLIVEHEEFIVDVRFFCFRLEVWKFLYLGKLFQKILKMFAQDEIWKLDLFEYVEFDGDFHFFSYLDWKYPFWVNLVQKFKILSLR